VRFRFDGVRRGAAGTRVQAFGCTSTASGGGCGGMDASVWAHVDHMWEPRGGEDGGRMACDGGVSLVLGLRLTADGLSVSLLWHGWW